MRFRAQDGYQRCIILLIAEARTRLEVPTVESSDLLFILEDFRYLYYEVNRSQWALKFFSESVVHESQNIFGA